MPLDPKGYNPPIMCNTTECKEEAVFEDYVQRADRFISLDLRLCEKHLQEMDETGTSVQRG
jgi:hypothetical protein